MEPDRPNLINATSGAFERMKVVLFRPFDLGKWFVIGFTAWLATLMEGGGGGSYEGSSGSSEDIGDEVSGLRETVGNRIGENLELVITIGSLIVLACLVFVIAILWIKARGKFMFLDNILHNRALVSHPWREFRTEGNSLFAWSLMLGLLVFLLLLGILAGGVVLSWPSIKEESLDRDILPGLFGLGFAFLLVTILGSYLFGLLEHFVIPTMHHDRIRTGEAWRRVLLLHSRFPGPFVLFFLWTILLGMGAGILIVVAVVATCCIAGLILVIPYLGAVFMLPVTVFFRSLGPEFLRQFGPEYEVYPEQSSPARLPDPNSGS